MARLLRTSPKKKNAAPGSPIFVGTQKQDKVQIDIVRYCKDEVEQFDDVPPQDCLALVQTEKVTWINIAGLHDTVAIEKLGHAFELHPLLVEDILNTFQRPKFESFEEHLGCVFKMLRISEKSKVVEWEQVGIVIGRNYLLSFQEATGDVFDPIRERILRPTTKIRHRGSDYLGFAMLDAVVDNYISSIEYFGNEIEDLEDSLLGETEPGQLVKINNFKREINALRRMVRPVIEIANRFEKAESPLISQKTLPFLRDLNDHVTQAAEAIEVYKELLNDEFHMYNASISNRLNDIMRVLTVFSVIFIPLTFIAGVYGANFEYMPELGFKYAYPVFWLVLIIVAGGMLYYFSRKKWL